MQDAYTENSGANDPNVSALVSWRNAAENVGVLFSGVFDKRNIRQIVNPAVREDAPGVSPTASRIAATT